MNKVSFQHIYTTGKLIIEDESYAHFHDKEMPLYFDGNFITFKQMPTINDFEKVEHDLIKFHSNRNIGHLKFYFPINKKLTDKWQMLLREKGYEIGTLELYAIKPIDFAIGKTLTDIVIQAVDEQNFTQFDNLQYEQDAQFGTDFANLKKVARKRDFLDDSKFQVIGYFKGIPVGTVDILLNEKTAEIDNLNVIPLHQRKGIGSALQQFAMNQFPNKTFILVADGDDTAKEMYLKQNYAYVAFQYEALKI